jgi:hypothetical protein
VAWVAWVATTIVVALPESASFPSPPPSPPPLPAPSALIDLTEWSATDSAPHRRQNLEIFSQHYLFFRLFLLASHVTNTHDTRHDTDAETKTPPSTILRPSCAVDAVGVDANFKRE